MTRMCLRCNVVCNPPDNRVRAVGDIVTQNLYCKQGAELNVTPPSSESAVLIPNTSVDVRFFSYGFC